MGSAAQFKDLILKHRGKRICVMGGSPDLAEHLRSVDADILISANGHGADIVKPDYLVAMDETEGGRGRPMLEVLRSRSDAPIISQEPFADFRLGRWPGAPRRVLSGMVGAWVAWAMGAKVVILAGMDGYDGSRLADSAMMERIITVPVRVVGGANMAESWKQYEPAERFGRYAEHPSIRGLLEIDEEVTVEVVKPTSFAGRDRVKGERATVMRHEVLRLLRHGVVREV